MTWADSMRVISDETQQLIDQVYDPDCDHIGPYPIDGSNVDAIETLLWDHGLVLDDNGYAVPVADEDEDDASILGDDDDADDPNLICSMCGCAIDPSALEETPIELEEAQ